AKLFSRVTSPETPAATLCRCGTICRDKTQSCARFGCEFLVLLFFDHEILLDERNKFTQVKKIQIMSYVINSDNASASGLLRRFAPRNDKKRQRRHCERNEVERSNPDCYLHSARWIASSLAQLQNGIRPRAVQVQM